MKFLFKQKLHIGNLKECACEESSKKIIKCCDYDLKGYLHYKTISCYKVALDVSLMNFFVWRKKMFQSWGI